jgi:hypothetical protein
MAVAGGNSAVTNRPQALAVLVAVFLFGGVLGATGSYYWVKRASTLENRAVDKARPPMPERPDWRKLLNLTSDQEESIRKIMSERWKQWESLRQEQAPKIEALQKEQVPKVEAFWAETNRQISSVLNEEQQKKFSELVKDMEKRVRSPRGRGFEPPPPERDRRRSSLEEGQQRGHGELPGDSRYGSEPPPRDQHIEPHR